MASANENTQEITFQRDPKNYKHWRLSFQGPIAKLVMKVDETKPLREGYTLKLNSYDLGVDIELADAIERLRFEHPEVKTVVVTSGHDVCFCAGANIYMLGSSSHGFKVNFCKFTNETRITIEEATAKSGQHYIAALNGVASGGGYELALACDKIYLQDDGSSAVSFPETPLLAVLPGTGGLTRLVDKRKVRRDLADVFSTLAEGIRGKRAKDWNLVDDVFPKSRFDEEITKRAQEVAQSLPDKEGPGLILEEINPQRESTETSETLRYQYVTLSVQTQTRVATLTVKGPEQEPPKTSEELRKQGNDWWSLKAFRELDRALLHLRFNHASVGVVLLKTQGDLQKVLSHDAALLALSEKDWLAREVLLLVGRVLRRLDNTARSTFALIEEGSCFAGSLLEMSLAADRSYIWLGDKEKTAQVALSPINFGPFTMYNGLTRLQTRFLGNPGLLSTLEKKRGVVDAEEAESLGLVTFALDDIDWEDDVRIAIEERASLSPDALTGMEANLRFAGPETMETKIFARLSAWQNWIFQRPNAVGERGALTMYGRPGRPEFDWRRT